MRILDAIRPFRYDATIPDGLEGAILGQSLTTYGWVWLLVGPVLPPARAAVSFVTPSATAIDRADTLAAPSQLSDTLAAPSQLSDTVSSNTTQASGPSQRRSSLAALPITTTLPATARTASRQPTARMPPLGHSDLPERHRRLPAR